MVLLEEALKDVGLVGLQEDRPTPHRTGRLAPPALALFAHCDTPRFTLEAVGTRRKEKRSAYETD